MDKVVMELPHTDMATKVVLFGLVKKKAKFDKFERNYKMTLFLLFFLCGAFLLNCYWLFGTGFFPKDELYLTLFKDRLNILLIISFALAFCWLIVMRRRSEKYEHEFEALRSEVIDRSGDFWQDESWDNRHAVYEIMDKHYQINLFFEKD